MSDADFHYEQTDEAHSDQLYLYKDATDTTAAVNTFTNTLKSTATVTVTKVWKDGNNADGLRPDAQTFAASLHLYADGQLVEGATPTVAKKGDGSYTVTYTGIPYSTVSTADDGTATVTPITYRVVEDLGKGNAYTAAYTNIGDYAGMTDGAYDGGTITNTHTPTVKPTATTKPTTATPTATLPKTSDPFSDLAALAYLLAGMGCGTTGVGLTLRRRRFFK